MRLLQTILPEHPKFCRPPVRVAWEIIRRVPLMTGLILERAGRGGRGQRALLADVLLDHGLDVPTSQCRRRSFGCVLVAISFPPCVTKNNSLTGGGGASQRSRREHEVEAGTGGPERDKQRK